MTRISVIIPTRNRAQLLRQAIESVLACGDSTCAIELLVIDDQSTDETAALLENYPVVYCRGQGRGVSAARNIGLQAATGDLITFLDDDDQWAPNQLLPRLRFLEQHPHYGAVCAQVLLGDETLSSYGGTYPDPPFRSGWMFEDFLSYIPQVGSLLVRREVVAALGGFDEQLHGGEDWDWALRLARHCQIGFLPEVVLLWRMHNTTRIDGAGNRRLEAVTWRRYQDMVSVARRHMKLSKQSWLRKQRILLKHKGHYVPIFLGYGHTLWQQGERRRALVSNWMALSASPLHVFSYIGRQFKASLQTRLAVRGRQSDP
jgi:glycosyltransferase involved in cell wall biosynthesis